MAINPGLNGSARVTGTTSDNFNFTGEDSYSLSFWFFPTDFLTSRNFIARFVFSSPNHRGWNMNIGDTDNKIKLQHWQATTVTSAVCTFPFTVVSWYHILVTYNGGTNIASFFVGGSPWGVLTGITGANTDTGDALLFKSVIGLSEVAIWEDKVLTSADAVFLSEKGTDIKKTKGRPLDIPNGLLGYWPLTGTIGASVVGNQVVDLSGNGYHGVGTSGTNPIIWTDESAIFPVVRPQGIVTANARYW